MNTCPDKLQHQLYPKFLQHLHVAVVCLPSEGGVRWWNLTSTDSGFDVLVWRTRAHREIATVFHNRAQRQPQSYLTWYENRYPLERLGNGTVSAGMDWKSKMEHRRNVRSKVSRSESDRQREQYLRRLLVQGELHAKQDLIKALVTCE